MKIIRDRAKDHLPTVLLTLLSIVQALALELLWSYVHDSPYLFTASWTALLTWIRVAASFTGIILIWIVYAGTALRFRWLPTTGDSVYPFVVGALEFTLIEALAPEYMGWWFLCLALIYGLMTWISHLQMRRARLDGSNDEFFAHFEPATIRDFYPAMIIVAGSGLAGLFLQVSGHRGILALLAAAGSLGILIMQLIQTTQFWDLTVSDWE